MIQVGKGQRRTWKEIVDTEVKDWIILNQQEEADIRKQKIAFDNFWTYVGKSYLEAKKVAGIEPWKDMEYQEGNVEELAEAQANALAGIARTNEKGVLILALDESGSMSGRRWNELIPAVIMLINQVHDMHMNPQDHQVIICKFGNGCRITFNGNLEAAY